MKMPKDIVLDDSEVSAGLIQFVTRCGNARGTAFRASGEHETQYDVLKAARLGRSTAVRGSVSLQFVQGETFGCFNVVGQVGFVFDDGVFTVEAYGFDFWVDPAEISEPIQIGDWVQLDIRSFTLYV